MSAGPITFAIQDAVDRAKRHGWTVCEQWDRRVFLCHLATDWYVLVRTDGMGHVVIERCGLKGGRRG